MDLLNYIFNAFLDTISYYLIATYYVMKEYFPQLPEYYHQYLSVGPSSMLFKNSKQYSVFYYQMQIEFSICYHLSMVILKTRVR